MNNFSPSPPKLYGLLKKAVTKAVTPMPIEKPVYLVSTCEPCQNIKTTHRRYCVPMEAKNTRFNSKVYIDFLYIELAHVLHMVDDATHFTVA